MRNLVLICLDTVRKDFFDEHAPRLQERAKITYEQCRAASSWSAPSHASMFTGELPSAHGVHAHNRDFSGLSRADTFLDHLPNHRAIGASANVWASSSFGFDRLFDEFTDISPDRRFPEGIHVAEFGQRCDQEGLEKQLAFLREALAHDHPFKSLANGALVQFDELTARAPAPKPLDDGAKTVSRQLRRHVEEGDEPFVAFANLMDAHGPLRHILGYDRSLHDAPLSWTSDDIDWEAAVESGDEAVLEQYKQLYAASIDYLDRRICALADELYAATDLQTTVVVTSDHGDNMATEADGGLWGHVESSLSEGLLHVPQVVLNAPSSGTDVIEEYTSHTSLGDLLVGLASGERPSVTADRIAAERIGNSGQLATVEGVDPAADRAMRCAYEGDRKRVWDSIGGRESYRLDADRPCWQERVDEEFALEAIESTFFERPIAVFKDAASADRPDADLDTVTEDRLRELGYL
jgi:arylsulfatase A-like enzyme